MRNMAKRETIGTFILQDYYLMHLILRVPGDLSEGPYKSQSFLCDQLSSYLSLSSSLNLLITSLP